LSLWGFSLQSAESAHFSFFGLPDIATPVFSAVVSLLLRSFFGCQVRGANIGVTLVQSQPFQFPFHSNICSAHIKANGI